MWALITCEHAAKSWGSTTSISLSYRLAKSRVSTLASPISLNGARSRKDHHHEGEDKPKNLVSTCGVTTAADPHQKKRYRNSEDGECTVYYKAVKRSKMVKDYFDGAAAIDVTNHLRQHGLNLESAWGTHRWDHHIAATMIGMCEVDAYLAYKYFEPGKGGVTHGEFTERLALKLIHNDFPGSDVYKDRRYRARRDSSGSASSSYSAAQPGGDVKHDLETLASQASDSPTKALKGGQGGGRKTHAATCCVCKQRAYFFCKSCSGATGKKVVLCGTGSKRGSACLVQHVIREYQQANE